MTPAGHPARPATDRLAILITILVVALTLLVVAGGCSTRKPGGDWPWVAESQTVADECGTLVTLGLGVKL